MYNHHEFSCWIRKSIKIDLCLKLFVIDKYYVEENMKIFSYLHHLNRDLMKAENRSIFAFQVL